MNHKTGSKLRKEVRALGRTQDASAGFVFDFIDRDLPNFSATKNPSAHVGQSPQSAVSNLNGGEVPAGGEAMVPIRQKQIPTLEGSLQLANAVTMRYRPNFVNTSEAIGRMCFRRPRYLQQRSKRTAWVITPEPQTAEIVVRRLQFLAAGGHTLRERLFMSKNPGFRAIEKPQDPFAKRLTAIAWEPETLAVYKEGGLRIPNYGCTVERMRRVFTGNVNGRGRRTKRSKRQENRHSEEIRVAGAAA
jgi:hypothetical protein